MPAGPGAPPPVRSRPCSPASTCGAPPATWLRSRLPRPDQGGAAPVDAVREILAEVRKRGDAAVREYTERFDGWCSTTCGCRRPSCAAALDAIPPALRAGARGGRRRRSRPTTATRCGPRPATSATASSCGSCGGPVDRAGAYVPGGRAGYPSTVLMTAIPARVAGVAEVVLCVPPGPDGRVLRRRPWPRPPRRRRRGVPHRRGPGDRRPWPTAPKSSAAVDVIVGPGNVYVAVAKREVAAEGVVGVPSAFAGPVRGGGGRRRHRPRRRGPPSTWSCRPSTAPTGWPGWSPGTRRWPTRSPTAVDPAGGGVAPPGRHRGDPGRRRLRGAGRRARAGHGGGQRHRPRAPRADVRRRGVDAGRRCATPARCSPGRGRRRRSATTWPGPATCCPRSARPASPAACRSTTSCSTIHVITLDQAALAGGGAARGRPGRRRGPRRPRPTPSSMRRGRPMAAHR